MDAVRRVRPEGGKRRHIQDVFGLRHRGVLLHRVPDQGLVRACCKLHKKKQSPDKSREAAKERAVAAAWVTWVLSWPL
jgi:hypothetical protein